MTNIELKNKLELVITLLNQICDNLVMDTPEQTTPSIIEKFDLNLASKKESLPPLMQTAILSPSLIKLYSFITLTNLLQIFLLNFFIILF